MKAMVSSPALSRRALPMPDEAPAMSTARR
jgi:hypothetical protein